LQFRAEQERCGVSISYVDAILGPPPPPLYSGEKVANRNVRVSGGRGAVSRRTPIPLDKIVARAHMYTYAAKVWDLSVVQGPFSVAPCQALPLRCATCAQLNRTCTPAGTLRSTGPSMVFTFTVVPATQPPAAAAISAPLRALLMHTRALRVVWAWEWTPYSAEKVANRT
jgi:hypothetical protein